MENMFYAFGWAQMTLHGDMLLRNYGTARGRAAEYWGEELLESDRRVHSLRIPERAREWAGLQSPRMRAWLSAFVAGINAYATQNPDYVDDSLEQVLPITLVDVFSHQQLTGTLPMAYGLAARDIHAWQERGSNTWVLDGSRTASGHPMLLVNGHVPWTDSAFRQMEVHLKSPEVSIYGTVVSAGSPIIPGGFTEHHAVGGTVNTLDNMDLYELTLAEGGYRWDKSIRAFDVASHTIKVRQADGGLREETFQSRWSIHGPVLAEKTNRAISVRLADLDQPFLYEQYWQMALARSFEEFERAVSRLQSPKSNMTYADRDGRIYYFTGSRIPRRSSGDVAYWAGIVPGDTAATLWTEVLDYEELPHFTDPPSGWIQNANDPPWYTTFPQVLKAENYPPWMSPVGMGFRPQRSVRLLTSKPKLTLLEFEALKLSTRMELADRLLDDLLPAARQLGNQTARQAAGVLEQWDRHADADSRGAVLFAAWVDTLSAGAREVPAEVFAQSWTPDRPLETPDGLSDPEAAVRALEAAATEVHDTWGSLDVPWGDVHRFRCPGGDWPANGGPGGLGIFRVIGYRPDSDGRQVAVGGDSFVAVIEMANPVRARVLMSYGNASQANLPFKCDQMELLARKEMRWAAIARADIEANLWRRETLSR
jgi:acyl-homoserine-lactone acylase